MGVLVAISIPIFTSQLEKSREAVDEANIRNAYAVIQAAALTEETEAEIKKNDTELIKFSEPSTTAGAVKYQAVITLKQQQDEWQSTAPSIGGMTTGQPSAGGTATIVYDEANGTTTLTFNAKSGS